MNWFAIAKAIHRGFTLIGQSSLVRYSPGLFPISCISLIFINKLADEKIANYNGYLLANNLGAPVVPTTNISPPSRYESVVYVGGLSTNLTDQSCQPPYFIQNQISIGGFRYGTKVNCYNIPSGEQYTFFERLQINANRGGAWAVKVFDTANCAGSSFQTINEKDFTDTFTPVGTCSKLAKRGVSVQVETLWNLDI